MKSKSAIAKGKRFEDFVSNEIEAHGLGKAQREIGSGSGKRKGDISCNLPFLIEAKNQKRIDIKRWVSQSKEQARIGNHNPNQWALVYRDPDYPEFHRINVVIDFWEWLDLLKKNSEPIIKEPDRDTSYIIRNLKTWLNKLEKKLN